MRMPRKDLLAALSKRHLSESSMVSRVLVQAKGSQDMMAAVVKGSSAAASMTMSRRSTGVLSITGYPQASTRIP